jgi:hypothetical protein
LLLPPGATRTSTIDAKTFSIFFIETFYRLVKSGLRTSHGSSLLEQSFSTVCLVKSGLRASHQDPLKSKANPADIIRLTIAVAQMVYTGWQPVQALVRQPGGSEWRLTCLN